MPRSRFVVRAFNEARVKVTRPFKMDGETMCHGYSIRLPWAIDDANQAWMGDTFGGQMEPVEASHLLRRLRDEWDYQEKDVRQALGLPPRRSRYEAWAVDQGWTPPPGWVDPEGRIRKADS